MAKKVNSYTAAILEVAYLMIHGELPNKAQNATFTETITNHTMLHDQVERFFQGYRRDSHPMAMMCGTVGAMSGFYHDDTHTTVNEARDIAMHRLIAKMPTIAQSSTLWIKSLSFTLITNKMPRRQQYA